jgi:hypothetical protein
MSSGPPGGAVDVYDESMARPTSMVAVVMLVPRLVAGPAELGAAHMRCLITANRRATATIAFFIPRRYAPSAIRNRALSYAFLQGNAERRLGVPAEQ